MAVQSSVRFVIFCVAAGILVTSCIAFRWTEFTEDPQFINKSMAGDAVVMYNDVTAMACAWHCASKYPCGGFAYKREERICMFCGMCSSFTLVDTPGFHMYVVTKGPADSSQNQASVCSDASNSPQPCWRVCAGQLVHVSVGPVGVWGIDASERILYRENTYQEPLSFGHSWSYIKGSLRQADVTTDTVWGFNFDNNVYRRQSVSPSHPAGTNWLRHTIGIMRWISVGPSGSGWGSDTNGQVVHSHPDSSSWQVVSGTDSQAVDAGHAGVWVLSTAGRILHRLGTYGDDGSTGTAWRALQGTFLSVSSGRDLVVAVDTAGHVWIRSGIGVHTPGGLAWMLYPGSLRQVDVYQTEGRVILWGTDSDNRVFYSVLNE